MPLHFVSVLFLCFVTVGLNYISSICAFTSCPTFPLRLVYSLFGNIKNCQFLLFPSRQLPILLNSITPKLFFEFVLLCSLSFLSNFTVSSQTIFFSCVLSFQKSSNFFLTLWLIRNLYQKFLELLYKLSFFYQKLSSIVDQQMSFRFLQPFA